MEQIFDIKKINQEEPGIVLLSHGPLATALLKTMELIYTEVENVAAFSLEEGDNVEEFYGEMEQALESYEKGCICLVDLMGGTPCNQLRKYSFLREKQVHGVLGMNLPMLLSAIEVRQTAVSLEEMVNQLIQDGQESIENFNR